MTLKLAALRKYFEKVISKDFASLLNENLKVKSNLQNLNISSRALSTAGYDDIIFRQLFDGITWTYTYLIADKSSGEAVLIDPVIEFVERDLKLIEELRLNLKFAMNTHMHADHITGTGLIKTLLPKVKTLISKNSGAMADVKVVHGEMITFGSQSLEVRVTPGHTNGCVTYVDHPHNMAYTGDSLLIRGCGRTDFQEGNSKTLFESVHSQILSLPKHFLLYPAHDYNGNTVTTVEEELAYNPRLTKTEAEFVKIMDSLNLSYPEKIDESLPANKVCGLYDLPECLSKKLEEAKLLKL